VASEPGGPGYNLVSIGHNQTCLYRQFLPAYQCFGHCRVDQVDPVCQARPEHRCHPSCPLDPGCLAGLDCPVGLCFLYGSGENSHRNSTNLAFPFRQYRRRPGSPAVRVHPSCPHHLHRRDLPVHHSCPVDQVRPTDPDHLSVHRNPAVRLVPVAQADQVDNTRTASRELLEDRHLAHRRLAHRECPARFKEGWCLQRTFSPGVPSSPLGPSGPGAPAAHVTLPQSEMCMLFHSCACPVRADHFD
jgi:hypothetical protein